MVTAPPKETILIVDDEKTVRRSLFKCLSRNGFYCEEAGNADEALESFEVFESKIVYLERDHNYHILVKDILRAIHGIKGNAGFFGLTNLRSIAHKLEDLLQDIL